MKMRKLLFALLVLPLTLVFDLILFALTRNCVGCTSFTQWVVAEGSLSFPLIAITSEWVSTLLRKKNTP